MKKGISVFLSFVLLLLLFSSFPVSAEASFVFTVVDNSIIRLITDDTFSYFSDNTFYVYYENISKLSVISNVYYNVSRQQVVVYNRKTTLYFDLSNNQTFDNSGNFYDLTAKWKDGNVFLPLDVLIAHFGLYASYFPGGEYAPAPFLRINSEKPSTSDAMLLEKLSILANSLYDDYQRSKLSTATSPGGTTAPPPVYVDPPTPVYFSFEGALNTYTPGILQALEEEDCVAAFFLSPDEMLESADLLREIYASGHTVGILLDGPFESADRAQAELRDANRLLQSIIYTKTRLVNISQGADKLDTDVLDGIISAGYRVWNGTVSPSLSGVSSAQAARNIRRSISEAGKTSVVSFTHSEETLNVLPAVLGHVLSDNYSYLVISDWDTPINSANEIR